MFVSLKERDATFKDRKRYEDKYFHLAIEGELAYVKWLKNKVEQVFLSFMQLPLHYTLFGENLITSVKKNLSSACFNLNYGKRRKEEQPKCEGRIDGRICRGL